MKLFVAAAVFAAMMFAQGPGPGGPTGPGTQPGRQRGSQAGPQQAPRVEELKAFLGLSDAQIQKLRALEPQKRQQLQAIFKEIGEKQKALHDQLQSGSANATTAGTLLVEIENLHKKARQLDASFHDQAVKALDAGQAEKLKKIEEVAKFMQMLEEARRMGPLVGEAAGLELVTAPMPMPGGPGPGQMGPRQGARQQRTRGMDRRTGPMQGPTCGPMQGPMQPGGSTGPGQGPRQGPGPGGPKGPPTGE